MFGVNSRQITRYSLARHCAAQRLRTFGRSMVVVLSAVFWVLSEMVFFSCAPRQQLKSQQHRLNDAAYYWHYRNLDSTYTYAKRAYELGGDRAEALNNLAFVRIAHMDYSGARKLLDEITRTSKNELELLVSDVQMMRLCQRQSANKDFYFYKQRAQNRLRRIEEERNELTEREQMRLVYARSEYAIVESTYFYYVGLGNQSREALADIDAYGRLQSDTAQWMAYCYMIGSGGILVDNNPRVVSQREFDYLVECYQLAVAQGAVYWQANSLQALSELLVNTPQSSENRVSWLIAENPRDISMLNVEHVGEDLLSGNLAQRSLDLFSAYGDVYQYAGSCRTLAACYWQIHDYNAALGYLQEALQANTAIRQAPDLVASIREQLSLAYSAIGDKANSDINRNLYLDMQETTRQDRQLEALAEQSSEAVRGVNAMIVAVVVLIVVISLLLLFFDFLRRRSNRKNSIEALAQPLADWQQREQARIERETELAEQLAESTAIARQHLIANKRLALEQRAKVSVVNSITPLIDRMKYEASASNAEKTGRYVYVAELADKIMEYNDSLTRWIQMRRGEFNLRIESFPLQRLFDIVAKGRTAFQMNGLQLEVIPTDAVVKADQTLTLFMINTMADNARKFTPKGGKVTVSAKMSDDYVEISVTDNGIGMEKIELARVFENKPIVDSPNVRSHHGFGLANCKGIIEKYKKTSRLFSASSIGAESEKGKGSRFFFRLPQGRLRMLVLLALVILTSHLSPLFSKPSFHEADLWLDSVYMCNLKGNFQQTLVYGDSCIKTINKVYERRYPRGRLFMKAIDEQPEQAAELRWFRDSLDMNYNIILSLRNEIAVAALALHDWPLYHYNNKLYTQLFREKSTDKSLSTYIANMQKTELNKKIAVTLLVLLLLLIFPAYYLLYYRHVLRHRRNVELVRKAGDVLLSDESSEKKLRTISSFTPLTPYPSPLTIHLDDIKKALRQSIEAEKAHDDNMEDAEDELRRIEYEGDRLHVVNSVLDNCLSTLKHETMYYPARIRALIEGDRQNLDTVAQLVDYYKELYTMLSAQAMAQIEPVTRVDHDMLAWLFEILQKKHATLEGEQSDDSGVYTTVTLSVPDASFTPQQVQELFTPSTVDPDFLLCRQIIREAGEATRARRCGIQARIDENGKTIIEIILTKAIWKNLKSSL